MSAGACTTLNLGWSDTVFSAVIMAVGSGLCGGQVALVSSTDATYASHMEADCEIEFFTLYTWQPTHEMRFFFFFEKWSADIMMNQTKQMRRITPYYVLYMRCQI